MTFPAQDTWQTPPEPIASMLDAPRLPVVAFSPDAEWIVELAPAELPPIKELSAPKVAIAGLQLNPQTWGPAKAGYYRKLSIRRRHEALARPIDLPENPRVRHLNWSRCGRYLSFTLTQLAPLDPTLPDKSGISLWILELETAVAFAL
ncbi:MAG: hypothetical protein WBD47_05610, partial [Phormidesmis sp.]